MKIAYFSSLTHSVDLRRHQLLAQTWGYKQSSDLFFDLSLIKNGKIELLLADSIDLRTLFRLCLCINLRKIRITFIALELFNFSFRALFQEVAYLISKANSKSGLNSILYFILVGPIRIFLLRSILFSGERHIIVPSALRIAYLKSILSTKIKFTLIRNKPVLSDLSFDKPNAYYMLPIQVKTVVERGDFLFIAGRLNDEIRFNQVCYYAKQMGLKVLTATTQNDLCLRSSQRFPGVLMNIGIVHNSLVIYLTSKCLAGICLYNNRTVNQRLSASSKFFEFMLMNKPVITTKNPGIEGEITSGMESFVIFIEQFCVQDCIPRTAFKLNEEFSFERELNDCLR